jgi:nitroreductase
MNVFEAINKRSSIRKWKDKPVEKEKIEKILEAARLAPSWGNVQPWRFIAVQDKEVIKQMAKAAGDQPVITTAPVVIVCCAVVGDFNKNLQRKTLKGLMDVGALDWSEDMLDNVVLESDLFSPYRLGHTYMLAKAYEQLMIAISYMTLQAVDLELGSCWMGAMSGEEVRNVLSLPEGIYVHDLLPIGYPDENPPFRPRKDKEEVIFWEKM